LVGINSRFPVIYTYQRWEVKFIEDSTGWTTDFVTQRNIRLVACVNPTSYSRGDEISKFTTYNSVRSCDVKTNHVNQQYNIKPKKDESSEDLDYLTDDEMDLLIEGKKIKINDTGYNKKDSHNNTECDI